MVKKITAGFKALLAFVKAHPIVLVLFLLVAGMFIIPWIFWGWNKARAALPESARNVIPAAEAKVSPPSA